MHHHVLKEVADLIDVSQIGVEDFLALTGPEEVDIADLAGLDPVAGLTPVGVEAAHEADHHVQMRMARVRFDHGIAFCEIER